MQLASKNIKTLILVINFLLSSEEKTIGGLYHPGNNVPMAGLNGMECATNLFPLLRPGMLQKETV